MKRELGRGGQAVVYLAWDPRLKRQVAVKTYMDPRLRGLVAVPDQVLRRVQREAEGASRLNHPGICTVYEVGDHEGAPYLAMQYVEGVPLSALLSRARTARDIARADDEDTSGAMLDISAVSSLSDLFARSQMTVDSMHSVLGLFENVARALHVAHEAGLVHRDIKPANIMVTPSQEPVILDFGLVRDLDQAGPDFTQSNEVVGTPYYMAPEQISHQKKAAVDRRTDIYALGTVLYESLTLQPLFSAATLDGLYHAILTREPDDPRRANPRISRDLKSILDVALDKDPRRRYQTALAFAEDLRRFRRQEPVAARSAGPLLRAARWARRNPLVASLDCIVAMLLVVGVIGTSYKNHQLRDASYLANVMAADASLRSNEIREAKRYLAECPRDMRGWEWHHLTAAVDMSRAILSGHTDSVVTLALRGDGAELVSGSADGTLRVWNPLTGECLRVFGAGSGGPVVAMRSVGQDGDLVSLRGSRDLGFSVWRGRTASPTPRARLRELPPAAVSISPAGDRIALAGDDGVIEVADTETGRGIITLGGAASRVSALAFSPDGTHILAGSTDGSVRLWDLGSASGALERKIAGAALALAFAGDGSVLAAGSSTGEVRIWNRPDGEEVVLPGAHDVAVPALALSPDGRYLATGSADKTIRIWAVQGGIPLRRWIGHEASIRSLVFGPEGSWLASGSDDATVRLWDVESHGPLTLSVAPATGTASALGLSAQGGRLAAGSPWPGRLNVLEIAGSTDLLRSAELDDDIRSVALSADGSRVAAGLEQSGQIHLWDLRKRAPTGVLAGHEDAVNALAFVGEGNEVVSGSRDRTVRIWSVDSLSVSRTLEGHRAAVTAVASMPGRRGVISGAEDGILIRWYAPSYRAMVLVGHTEAVLSLALSRDGDRLASGAQDGEIRIWDVSSGALLGTLSGHEQAVTALAFSPDARRVVSGSLDHTVRVWEPEAERRLLTLRGHEAGVGAIVFTPDGSTIVSAATDRAVRSWTTASGSRF